jgi:hypothetical protein
MEGSRFKVGIEGQRLLKVDNMVSRSVRIASPDDVTLWPVTLHFSDICTAQKLLWWKALSEADRQHWWAWKKLWLQERPLHRAHEKMLSNVPQNRNVLYCTIRITMRRRF